MPPTLSNMIVQCMPPVFLQLLASSLMNPREEKMISLLTVRLDLSGSSRLSHEAFTPTQPELRISIRRSLSSPPKEVTVAYTSGHCISRPETSSTDLIRPSQTRYP